MINLSTTYYIVAYLSSVYKRITKQHTTLNRQTQVQTKIRICARYIPAFSTSLALVSWKRNDFHTYRRDEHALHKTLCTLEFMPVSCFAWQQLRV